MKVPLACLSNLVVHDSAVVVACNVYACVVCVPLRPLGQFYTSKFHCHSVSTVVVAVINIAISAITMLLVSSILLLLLIRTHSTAITRRGKTEEEGW